MTMSIGGGATPPVTFNTPLGEMTGAQVNNATLANPQSTNAGAQTGLPPTPPGAAQAVNGTAQGGGAAAPTGPAQAATGAKDAQGVPGGGPAGDQQAQLIDALKSLIAVLNQLVTALSAQVGGAQGGGPTDGKGGGPGGKVGGETGGPVQQTPMQMGPMQKGISQGGGGSMPGMDMNMPGMDMSMPGMAMPAAGAQPAAPTTGGGATAADGHAHTH
jgi:hypothetical protein